MQKRFLDATLASDMTPFVSRTIISAVKGFEATTWTIRNSSLMVFTAVIRRSIDNRANADFSNKRTTIKEF